MRAAGLVALLVLTPIVAGSYIGQVMLLVGLYMLMGMGLNLEVGLAGLLDLGFVAFFAVGAYATALLTADSPHALASYTPLPSLSLGGLGAGSRQEADEVAPPPILRASRLEGRARRDDRPAGRPGSSSPSVSATTDAGERVQ